MSQRTFPAGFIAPCLPTKTDKLPSGGQWLHEIKHDGFRIIARKDGDRVRLYSRPGNDFTRRFPLIAEALTGLRSRSCIIDGEASERHAQIRRINLDGSGAEVIARGIRQIVGMDFDPTSKQLYFSENQRDWLSEELPNDKLNRLVSPGKEDFGFPRCHQGDVPDPEFGWGRGCEGVSRPLALLGPHSAPLGVRFYTGSMFPTEYSHALFIARHGSWNKTKKIGGDIVVAMLNPDGTVKSWTPFITGFLQDNNYIGRPVDMLQIPDGSLLISDDWNGAVYRLSYSKPQ